MAKSNRTGEEHERESNHIISHYFNYYFSNLFISRYTSNEKCVRYQPELEK